MTIKEAIQKLVLPLLLPFNRSMLVCTVVGGFDANKYTINVQPLDDSPEFAARIQCSERNDFGSAIIPKQGSKVWVNRPPMWAGTAYITKAEDYDKVLLKVGPFKLELKAVDGKLILNDGTKDGIPIAANVCNEINEVKVDIANLKNFFAAWEVVPSDGGAALKTITAPWYGQPLANTVVSEIENPDIKQ